MKNHSLLLLGTLCLSTMIFTACVASGEDFSNLSSGNPGVSENFSSNTQFDTLDAGVTSENEVSDYGIPENVREIVSENSTLSTTLEPLEYEIQDGIIARFTSYDFDTTYDIETATLLSFSEDSLSVTGEGVSVDGNQVIIFAAGTYILEGTLTDGQIYINVGDDDKVQLVLNGVSLSCSNGPVIYSANADKTIITLASGTENFCTDAVTYDTSDANGCIYSKQDLTINGNGTLTVTGNFGNGISTKDDLRIFDATLYVTAVNNGLKGNDSVLILDSVITVVSKDDGVKSDNDSDPSKGFIYIANSYLDITAEDDAFQAFRAFVIREHSVAYVRCYGKDINCDYLIQNEGEIITWM